ncbi:MAG: bifunctional precorrin-2 dehydrogenase/sirohydrochlorin ferrochelatase [Candidatus Dormibacteraeota bacterium]|nr:bifunctional precorrin-2 dehydrogenase/sirohydrochlorin ferrochelatase [Candidatus Dormibacteraeota bacterium]
MAKAGGPGGTGYYPVYLDLAGKSCLVLGGGAPACDKALGLVAAGADVSVVAEAFEPEMVELGGTHAVRLLCHAFAADDLDGVLVVIDASLDEALGRRVAEAARRRRVLVNVLDRPALCDFIAPAVVRRGPLQVAVSTAGRSPFMASHVRRLLEATLGPEYGELVDLVGELRDSLRADGVPLTEQAAIYERVPRSGALELLREGDYAGARRVVQACVTDPSEVEPALLG